MTLWIDGDSCPRKAMDIAVDLTGRTGTRLRIAADREIPGFEERKDILTVLTHGGGGVDDYIVSEAASGDAAVTRDLELGMRLLRKGLTVLNDRGRVWTERTLARRMEEAGVMQAMRAGGMVRGGMRSYDSGDAGRFAGALKEILKSD